MQDSKTALYEELKRRILTVSLEPGSSLDETRIGAEFSLSRTPVREVFRRLAGEGYIEITENKGARISALSLATLRNFFLVAPVIYSAAARLAIQNYQAHQLIDLKETQARFILAVEKEDRIARVLENNRFHAIIGEMSANPYLLPSLERLLIDHSRIGMTFYLPQGDRTSSERLEKAVSQHNQMIEALEKRDEEAMLILINAHWELSRINMELYAMPQSLALDE